MSQPATATTTTAAAAAAAAGFVLIRPGDGAWLTAADLACCLPLHHGELQELAQLLTLVEDWLLHSDDDVLADLARFLHDRPPADLIDELGTQSVKLHRLARATT